MTRVFVLGAFLALASPASAGSGYRVSATSFCESGLMADGSHTRPGVAAANNLRLGSRIRLTGVAGPGGRRDYVIRDRIGAYSSLDLWTSSCSEARNWGRKTVSYVVAR